MQDGGGRTSAEGHIFFGTLGGFMGNWQGRRGGVPVVLLKAASNRVRNSVGVVGRQVLSVEGGGGGGCDKLKSFLGSVVSVDILEQ